ncbi:hypothetical protein L3X38_043326 [Prunus dulcis]|uniref:Uncharacterized protein n=1 Tax=Prunus dulcis TaxID=3755 RepID=A0AAD4UWI3_PRUDU|nr:hypothetical protein L3X38_043326 [Prunus dulcis]
MGWKILGEWLGLGQIVKEFLGWGRCWWELVVGMEEIWGGACDLGNWGREVGKMALGVEVDKVCSKSLKLLAPPNPLHSCQKVIGRGIYLPRALVLSTL